MRGYGTLWNFCVRIPVIELHWRGRHLAVRSIAVHRNIFRRSYSIVWRLLNQAHNGSEWSGIVPNIQPFRFNLKPDDL